MAVRRSPLSSGKTKSPLASGKKAPVKKRAARKKKSTSSAAVAMPVNREETVTIRKISNGYIVRKSTYAGDQYKEHEKFVAQKPKLNF